MLQGISLIILLSDFQLYHLRKLLFSTNQTLVFLHQHKALVDAHFQPHSDLPIEIIITDDSNSCQLNQDFNNHLSLPNYFSHFNMHLDLKYRSMILVSSEIDLYVRLFIR